MDKGKILNLASTAKVENKFIEFKSELNVNSPLSWCEIVKDAVALANSGGGIILFGVENNGTHNNFDRNVILNLDPATITDKVSKYLNEDFTEFEIIEMQHGKKKVAALYVSGSSIPIVFSKNGVQTSEGKKFKSVFAEGSVYFRRGAKSRPGHTGYIKRSFEKRLAQVRKEWFKGMRQVSEIGIGETVKEIQLGRLGGASANLHSLIKISESGNPVRFTNERVEELKRLFPMSYHEVCKACRKKRKTRQKELQDYINRCKENNSLSINWKLVHKNLKIPASIADKFTYSPEVVEKF